MMGEGCGERRTETLRADAGQGKQDLIFRRWRVGSRWWGRLDIGHQVACWLTVSE